MGIEEMDGSNGIKEDNLKQAYCPFRRYFARTLDMFIGEAIVIAISFFLGVRLGNSNFLICALLTIIGFIVYFFLDALLIHLTGTTVGKAVFGLRVTNSNNEKLSFRYSLSREWDVFVCGFGVFIPIYSQYRLIRSFVDCVQGYDMSWDDYCTISLKDRNGFRIFLYVLTIPVQIFIIWVFAMSSFLPVNRGNVTLQEFAENFNFYKDCFDKDGIEYMNDEGQIVDKEVDYIVTDAQGNIIKNTYPKYSYIIEDGYVKGFSYTAEVTNLEKKSFYSDNMYLDRMAVMALCCASSDNSIFSDTINKIQSEFDNAYNDLNSSLEINGYKCNIEIEQNGFLTDGICFWAMDSTNYLKIHISVQQQ